MPTPLEHRTTNSLIREEASLEDAQKHGYTAVNQAQLDEIKRELTLRENQ